MGDNDIPLRVRRALLMVVPAAVSVRFLSAQTAPTHFPGPPADDGSDVGRLPSGALQRDAIVKSEYAKNLKDARGLIDQAKSFEEDLEKNDRYVLSVASLKKLDDMEKTIHRIRDRMKHS
jgi:hypothetical protein